MAKTAPHSRSKINMIPLTDEETDLVNDLRKNHPNTHLSHAHNASTLGERLADKITALVGSWHFLMIQSTILIFWLILNVIGFMQHWDPYPFILLNLILSFQAAYTAPIIMMSQNREAQIDRKKLETYYKINLKQELEIRILHEKLDHMTDMLKALQKTDNSEGADARCG